MREDVFKLFRKGHSPSIVAKAIYGAIVHDKPVVPVGIEAQIGWILHRLLPARAIDGMARKTMGKV